MDTKTILIDGFEGFTVSESDMDPMIDESCDVVVIKREDDIKLNLNLSIKLNYILSDTRLGAFYKVKTRIDNRMSSELNLYCSEDKGDFWETVCNALLTPTYKWKLTLPHSSYRPIYDKSFLPDIQAFLRSFKTEDNIVILKSNLIDSSFNHGFSTRKGGLSTVPGVASLNMTPASIKRDSELIGKENVRRLGEKAEFDPETFFRARAVHGNTVYVIGKEEPNDGYDCVISNQRNVTVAAPGADCVMILFADPKTPAFGACHSGWRGTVAKACVETIKKMQEEFGTKVENVQVVLGPNIGPCCLEFNEQDVNVFKNIHQNCVIRKEGHDKPFIDLCLANRTLLESIGVLSSNIDDTSATLCTTCNPDLLFSYRRDKIPFGNQVGFIGLR